MTLPAHLFSVIPENDNEESMFGKFSSSAAVIEPETSSIRDQCANDQATTLPAERLKVDYKSSGCMGMTSK